MSSTPGDVAVVTGASRGIESVAVLPGSIDTDMLVGSGFPLS